MNTSEQILVVFLSVALAVLLVVAIFVAVQAFRLLKVINRISEKAEHIVESAEHVTEAFSNATANAAGPLAILKVVQNVMNLVSKSKTK